MQELLTGARRLPGFTSKWETKHLEDVGEIDIDNLDSETAPDFTFYYIALEDVNKGTLQNYSEQVFATAPSRARRRLRSGDILISTVRPNLQSHLLFKQNTNNWVCSTGFAVLRCNDKNSPCYIFAYLFSEHITKQLESLITGSNYPAINSNDVRNLQINLPLLNEQTAIAQILSEMDEELAALEAQRNKARQLKQGMMRVLLTGEVRLV